MKKNPIEKKDNDHVIAKHVEAVRKINALLDNAARQHEIPMSQFNEEKRIALIRQAPFLHGNIKKMIEENLSSDDDLQLMQALINIKIIRESFRDGGMLHGIVVSVQIERMICNHLLKAFKKKFDERISMRAVFDWFARHCAMNQAVNDVKMTRNLFVSLMTLNSYHQHHNDSNKFFDLMLRLINIDREKQSGVIDFSMAQALLKHIELKKDQSYRLFDMPYDIFEYLVRDEVVDPLIEKKEYRKLLKFFQLCCREAEDDICHYAQKFLLIYGCVFSVCQQLDRNRLVGVGSEMQVILHRMHQCKDQLLSAVLASDKSARGPVHPGVIALRNHIDSQQLSLAEKTAIINAIPLAMAEIPKGSDAFNSKMNHLLNTTHGTDNNGLFTHLNGLQAADSSWFSRDAARHAEAQPFAAPSEMGFFINKQNVCQFVFTVPGIKETCCICFADNNQVGLQGQVFEEIASSSVDVATSSSFFAFAALGSSHQYEMLGQSLYQKLWLVLQAYQQSDGFKTIPEEGLAELPNLDVYFSKKMIHALLDKVKLIFNNCDVSYLENSDSSHQYQCTVDYLFFLRHQYKSALDKAVLRVFHSLPVQYSEFLRDYFLPLKIQMNKPAAMARRQIAQVLLISLKFHVNKLEGMDESGVLYPTENGVTKVWFSMLKDRLFCEMQSYRRRRHSLNVVRHISLLDTQLSSLQKKPG